MCTTLFKRAGLPVFPPHADPGAPSVLQDLLQAEPWRAELAFPPGFAGGLAHRLDTLTSGALLVADDPEELAEIRRAFADRALTKTYLLVSRRRPPWTEHEARAPIAHDPRRKARMVVQRGSSTPHRGSWFEAQTRFRHLGGHLLQATMRSGVMHQIRVHAAFLGVPLAGDAHYGGGPPFPGTTGFCLHHVGLTGPFSTTPVEDPTWVTQARSIQTGA